MVATERQPRNDGLRRIGRHRAGFRQPEADDAVIHLGIERAVIECDAGSSGRALRRSFAEAADDIGLAVAIGVFQGDQEPARRRLVVTVIEAAPRVDINDAIAGRRHVPGVTQVLGKDGGAESWRQGNARILLLAVGGVILGRDLGVSRSAGRSERAG
jgi:hypothetical protein